MKKTRKYRLKTTDGTGTVWYVRTWDEGNVSVALTQSKSDARVFDQGDPSDTFWGATLFTAEFIPNHQWVIRADCHFGTKNTRDEFITSSFYLGHYTNPGYPSGYCYTGWLTDAGVPEEGSTVPTVRVFGTAQDAANYLVTWMNGQPHPDLRQWSNFTIMELPPE